MELRNLRTFHAVAESLNLTKAAEQLGYSQPTITLQIKALEKELGKPLLNRVGKRTFLTPTGKLLKTYTDRLFAVLREMEEELEKINNPHGTLTVATPEVYCTLYLPAIMSSYIKQHPLVKLQLISCNSLDSMRMVSENRADVGIISGSCDLPELKVDVIDREEFVLVTTPEIMAENDLKSVLAKYPFISFQQNCNLDRFINSCLEEINYRPAHLIECSSEETVKRVVLKQVGVALLSTALIGKELEAGELVVLHRFSQRADTSLIYLKNRESEAAIQSFAELVRDSWRLIRDQDEA